MNSNLAHVTITGADDSTSAPALVELSAEFPFVEWGILVSKRQEGSYRFPSRGWIDSFAELASNYNLQVSTHVCGAWVREMFTGDLDWKALPSCVHASKRIQINTHAERPKPFWIDMERRVRTADDSALDMDAVRRVLVACKTHMEGLAA